MNDVDLSIQEKIKKREKMDIILAYILIVILLGGIIFILYLKFIKNNDEKEVNTNQTEYVANYIKLEDISSFVYNDLNPKYSGITVYNDNNLIGVDYGDISYIINLLNNELEFKNNDDNKELSEDIYKSIVTSVCSYYNDDIDGCKNAANSIKYGENTTGIRFVDKIMYISITNSITPIEGNQVNNLITYDSETITDLENINYKLNIKNKTISDIDISMNSASITISGAISENGLVTVKLYDSNEKVLEEKSANTDTNFSIKFDYNDKLNTESIKKYSINIE